MTEKDAAGGIVLAGPADSFKVPAGSRLGVEGLPVRQQDLHEFCRSQSLRHLFRRHVFAGIPDGFLQKSVKHERQTADQTVRLNAGFLPVKV
jgi:hypothetical protein